MRAPRSQIILSVAEHHSNLVPWQLVAAKTGAVIKHVGLTATQELDMQARTPAGPGLLNGAAPVVSPPARPDHPCVPLPLLVHRRRSNWRAW